MGAYATVWYAYFVSINDERTGEMVQHMITTEEFRRGQKAAWTDFEKDEDMQPNRALLARLKSEEFAAGYCDEYNNFIVPVRNGAPRGTR